MKTLTIEQMEIVQGGKMDPESLIGLMCGATLILAFSGIFAPFAAATGAGCATGLYAMDVWANQSK